MQKDTRIYLKNKILYNIKNYNINDVRNRGVQKYMKMKKINIEDFIMAVEDEEQNMMQFGLLSCLPGFSYDSRTVRPDSKRYFTINPFAPNLSAVIPPDVTWSVGNTYTQTNITAINSTNFWIYNLSDATSVARHSYFDQATWIAALGLSNLSTQPGQIGFLLSNQKMVSNNYQYELAGTTTSSPANSLLNADAFTGNNKSFFYINLNIANFNAAALVDNVAIIENGVDKTVNNFNIVSDGSYPTSTRPLYTSYAIAREPGALWLSFPIGSTVGNYSNQSETAWIKLLKTTPSETWYFYFLTRKAAAGNAFSHSFFLYGNATYTSALGWPA